MPQFRSLPYTNGNLIIPGKRPSRRPTTLPTRVKPLRRSGGKSPTKIPLARTPENVVANSLSGNSTLLGDNAYGPGGCLPSVVTAPLQDSPVRQKVREDPIR